MKKYISLVIKIAITIAIFYLLLKDQDFDKFRELYIKADSLFLILSVIVVLISIFILSVRWSRINKIFNFNLNQLELYKHYLIAYGFNSFLPSAIGGDIWRIRFLTKTTQNKLDSLVSPFLERITGMIAVLCVIPIAFMKFGQYVSDKELNNLVYVILLVLVGVILFLFTKLGLTSLSFLLKKELSTKWNDRILKLTETFKLIYLNRIRMFEGVVLSLVTQFVFTLSCWLSFYAFGGSIYFFDFYLVIIIMYITTTLPISFNGYGIREATIIWGLTKFGITIELSTVVALFISFLTLVPSLVGGAVFLLSKEELKDV